jgi:cyclase
MNLNLISKLTTRRQMLRATTAFAGGTLLSGYVPAILLVKTEAAARLQGAQQASPASSDMVARYRAEMATLPLQTLKLRNNLHVLSGPGGNVIVLNGPDGKLVVDTFVAPAWSKLKQTLDGLSEAPLKFVINTHWHFDHVDNNAALHDAGGTILAHENTRKRLAAPQEIAVFGMHFPASPAKALPQQTFKDSFQIYFNNEELALGYIPPAHTDTDIYVRFQNADVLHMGDTYFSGSYPFIDASTGGNINGMIAAADKGIGFATSDTKIVPGHGPVGDKTSLTKWRDMLSVVRDRVQKQKTAGKTLQEVIDAKPTGDLDATWGSGRFKPDFFVTLVYTTL